MKSSIELRLLFFVIMLGLFMEQQVRAFYIDPGSGSLLLQALMAAFVGALYYFRRGLAKVLRRDK